MIPWNAMLSISHPMSAAAASVPTRNRMRTVWPANAMPRSSVRWLRAGNRRCGQRRPPVPERIVRADEQRAAIARCDEIADVLPRSAVAADLEHAAVEEIGGDVLKSASKPNR